MSAPLISLNAALQWSNPLTNLGYLIVVFDLSRAIITINITVKTQIVTCHPDWARYNTISFFWELLSWMQMLGCYWLLVFRLHLLQYCGFLTKFLFGLNKPIFFFETSKSTQCFNYRSERNEYAFVSVVNITHRHKFFRVFVWCFAFPFFYPI